MIQDEHSISRLEALGNDVVDRADPRFRGKSGDQRFLGRVYTAGERDAIEAASDPDVALWARWAGKEAAFKSASKVLGSPPVFNHPEFRVSELEPFGGELAGRVEYEGMTFSLAVLVTHRALHALSWRGLGAETPCGHDPFPFPPILFGLDTREANPATWRDELRAHLTPMEWSCVSHRGSALTRLAAKDALADALGAELSALEIGCGPGLPGRRIPRVFLNGEEMDVELTLSHHNRFQAWAFRVP